MREASSNLIPLLANKHFDRPPVFDPVNLLREARRQRSLPTGSVPEICVLDPDGDLLRHLRDSETGRSNPYWACYHTELWDFHDNGLHIGLVGCAVGASFAVLVAEELFASGCKFLISITSAGQILPVCNPPYFVLIDRALRDEGTSYHYQPPARYSYVRPGMQALLDRVLHESGFAFERGGVWTTDAPFRETQEAIDFARREGLLAVEMEAAALYAFAEAKQKPVACFARVTNQMGTVEGDFEKGEADGNAMALELIRAIARGWRTASS